MSITLSTGTQVAVAQTYGTGFTITAITNATEGVATLSASHGIVVNDIFEVSSGWGRLDKRLVRAKVVATNDVTMESINTSSTTFYPTGLGTGTGREITAFASITQIKEPASSGGETQFTDITTLDDVLQKQAPTVQSPYVVTLTVYDDPTLSWYAIVQAAMDSNAITGLRFTFPSGAKAYLNGYISLQQTPTIAINTPLTTKVTFTAIALVTRYTS